MGKPNSRNLSGRSTWLGDRECALVHQVIANWEFPGPPPDFNSIVRHTVQVGCRSILEAIETQISDSGVE